MNCCMGGKTNEGGEGDDEKTLETGSKTETPKSNGSSRGNWATPSKLLYQK